VSAPKTGVSGTAVVIGVVVAFCVVVTAVVVLLIAAPADRDVSTTIPALLAAVGTLGTSLLALLGIRSIDQKVDYLANGGTDAKIRAGIADVVKPELLKDDDSTAAQLDVDRAHRAAGPNGKES
jgi:hypothetical protein